MKKCLIILLLTAAVLNLAGCRSSYEIFVSSIEKGDIQAAGKIYENAKEKSKLDEWLIQMAEEIKVEYINKDIEYKTVVSQLEMLLQFQGSEEEINDYLDAAKNERNNRLVKQKYDSAREMVERGEYREALAIFEQVDKKDALYYEAREVKIKAIDALLEPLLAKTHYIDWPLDLYSGLAYVPKGFRAGDTHVDFPHWNLDKANIYPALLAGITHNKDIFIVVFRITMGYISSAPVDIKSIRFHIEDKSYHWHFDDSWTAYVGNGLIAEWTVQFKPGRQEGRFEQLKKVVNADSATIEFIGQERSVKRDITQEELENLRVFIELYELYLLKIQS